LDPKVQIKIKVKVKSKLASIRSVMP